MYMFERVPAFDMVSFANIRSIVDVCPLLSSLVGMFGLFLRLNVRLWSHSSVHLVFGVGASTPSSQDGSLMFQLPPMIVGVR